MTITLTGDDGDPEVVQSLTYIITALPGTGTLYTTSGDPSGSAIGVVPFTLAGPTLYFVTAQDNATDQSFSWKVDDGQAINNESDVQAETITVTAVNDRPTLSDPDAQTVNEDTNVGISFTVGDVDVNEAPGELRASLAVGNGTLTLAVTTGLNFSLCGNGQSSMTFTGTLANVSTAMVTVTYRGDADYNGPDTLTVDVSDQGATGIGGILSENVTVNLTVNPVADVVNDTDTTDVDTAKLIDVLANDGFGGSTNITAVTQGANGTVTITGGGANVTYTPNADWHGSDNSFTYTVGNAGADETATVDVTVNPVADALDDTDTATEDTAKIVDVLANDGFIGTKTVTAVTQGTNGTVTITGAGANVTYTRTTTGTAATALRTRSVTAVRMKPRT